jgi:hypothetical protein
METHPEWLSPKVQIKEASLRGQGMFAKEKIMEGERILSWGGTYVEREEAEKAKTTGKLVMQWEDNLFSIEDRGESLTYFINHSCQPNCWMRDTFSIISMRDIGEGEELTADYALWETDENYVASWTCGCGSPLCRHQITGKDWRLSELQRRYKDHFIPLINQRIAKLI